VVHSCRAFQFENIGAAATVWADFGGSGTRTNNVSLQPGPPTDRARVIGRSAGLAVFDHPALFGIEVGPDLTTRKSDLLF
jgi:hypothetical protein